MVLIKASLCGILSRNSISKDGVETPGPGQDLSNFLLHSRGGEWGTTSDRQHKGRSCTGRKACDPDCHPMNSGKAAAGFQVCYASRFSKPPCCNRGADGPSRTEVTLCGPSAAGGAGAGVRTTGRHGGLKCLQNVQVRTSKQQSEVED